MKRLLISALSLTLLLALALPTAGCGGETTGGEPDGGSTTGGSATSEDAITSIEDLKAALERDHADAEWLPDVTDITLETYLGAPVLALHVPWNGPDVDYEAQNRKQSALSDALATYDVMVAPNFALRDANGAITSIGGGGVGVGLMNEVFDLPPAPQTAEEIRSWLTAVYGPGGLVALGANETWYDTIVSIEMGDYGSGANDILMVTTSAPTGTSTDASLIVMALQTTGSPLLVNYAITAADGSGSSGSASVNGPGASGWLYPAK